MASLVSTYLHKPTCGRKCFGPVPVKCIRHLNCLECSSRSFSYAGHGCYCYACDSEFKLCESHQDLDHFCPLKQPKFSPMDIPLTCTNTELVNILLHSFDESQNQFNFIYILVKGLGKMTVISYYNATKHCINNWLNLMSSFQPEYSGGRILMECSQN